LADRDVELDEFIAPIERADTRDRLGKLRPSQVEPQPAQLFVPVVLPIVVDDGAVPALSAARR
jgi:hypothetical protein